MNIITIRSEFVDHDVARKFMLVPDSHDGNPKWYKIVVMDHVKQGLMDRFLMELKSFPEHSLN